MEINPVTTAKSTSADSSSPSPVKIFDGNSSLPKIENTPVTTAEDTNGDSLSLVAGAEPVIDARIQKEKMESNPVTTAKATSADSSLPSPVEIFDGNSSPQKIDLCVTTDEDTFVDCSTSFIDLEERDEDLVISRKQSRDLVPRRIRLSLSSPSFQRPNGVSTGATMEFNGSKTCVIIRPTASVGGKKPKEKDDEEIPEEQAVCKFCFNVFAEENVLKTKCRCKTGLVHDKCASHHFNELGNNKCKVCHQEVKTIPVILLRRPFSIKKNKQESKLQKFLLRLKRLVR